MTTSEPRPETPLLPGLRTETRPAFTLIGISARVSNSAPEKIGALWARFMSEGVLAKIPNRVNDDVYSLYSEYESDQNGPYSVLIGAAVTSAAEVPDGMTAQSVPAATYAVIPVRGLLPGAVVATWINVWQTPLARTFSADFDLYRKTTGGLPEVSVHIAIRPE